MSMPPTNQYLGLPVDARYHRVVAKIILLLGIRPVGIITGNSDKIAQPGAAGVPVVDRIPVVIPANPNDQGAIEAKREKMGYLL